MMDVFMTLDHLIHSTLIIQYAVYLLNVRVHLFSVYVIRKQMTGSIIQMRQCQQMLFCCGI